MSTWIGKLVALRSGVRCGSADLGLTKNKAKHGGLLGYNFVEMHDYNKANVEYERQLSIAKEIKDLALEANALQDLGDNHNTVCVTTKKPWSTWNRDWFSI